MSKPAAVIVPQINPNDDTAVLVRWHVTAGDRVVADQLLVTLETTKAAFDVHAPGEGYVHFERGPGDIIAVGAAVAWIADQPTRSEPRVTDVPVKASGGLRADGPATGFTRKALRLMEKYGLVPTDFDGLDQVMTSDVERLRRERDSRNVNQTPEGFVRLEQPPSKLIEAQALGETYREAVPSIVTMPVSGEKVRRRLAAVAAETGPVSLLELVIHASAGLLGDYPELNGFYAGGRAWRATSIAVGFAVNMGRGLRVPVIKHADKLPLLEVVKAVRELSLKYMRDELEFADLIGGTFTITDLSSYGVSHFVPVLNQRQSAILGVCAEHPADGCQNFVMSFDHRMSDGMQAAKFLAQLRDLLEEPLTG